MILTRAEVAELTGYVRFRAQVRAGLHADRLPAAAWRVAGRAALGG